MQLFHKDRVVPFISFLLCILLGYPLFVKSSLAHPTFEIRIGRVNAKIKKDPKNAKLYLKRGDLYREHESWDAALADFNRSRAINPGLVDIDLSIAELWLDAKEPKKALEALNQYLGNKPGSPEGLSQRARAYVALGNFEAAVKDFDKAITNIQTPSPDLYVERARCSMKLGSEHLEKTHRDLEEGIKHLGPIVTLVEVLVDIDQKRARYKEALEHIDSLPPILKEQAKWLMRRGDLHGDKKEPSKAEKAYKQALSKIAQLPPRRREVKAVKALKEEIDGKLTALILLTAKTEHALR